MRFSMVCQIRLALVQVGGGEQLLVARRDAGRRDLREASSRRHCCGPSSGPEQKPVVVTFQPPVPLDMSVTLVVQSTIFSSTFMPAAFISSVSTSVASCM